MSIRSHILLTFSFLVFLICPPAAKGEIDHKVKTGENLRRIARQYHVSVARIQEANELDDASIRAGQRLIIPVDSTKSGKTPGKNVAKQGSSENEAREREIPDAHVVKKGETLAKIAIHYGLRVADLQAINGFQGKKLKAGQVLQLKSEGEDLEGTESELKEPDRERIETASETDHLKPVFNGDGFFQEEKDRQLLVRAAKAFLGVRYRLGGASINGMDCSAFVQKVFKIFAIDLPRTAREQFRMGYEVSRDSLRIGDLLFFTRSKARHPTHVGIYIGDGQFIHTSLHKRRVEIENLGSGYFNLRFLGAKRIEDEKKSKDTDNIGN